jgi:hypothetical protein
MIRSHLCEIRKERRRWHLACLLLSPFALAQAGVLDLQIEKSLGRAAFAEFAAFLGENAVCACRSNFSLVQGATQMEKRLACF